MADDDNTRDDQPEEQQTQGNEPDQGAQQDGTAELEQDQDQAESTQEAVNEGKETARENLENDKENQPVAGEQIFVSGIAES